jgi:hypothetical protein
MDGIAAGRARPSRVPTTRPARKRRPGAARSCWALMWLAPKVKGPSAPVDV